MASLSRKQFLRLGMMLGLASLLPVTAAPKKKRAPAAKQPSAAPAPSPSLAPGELPLAALGATVIDGATGAPIYAKNPDTPLFPASSTKILTALLVIEEGHLDAEVTVELSDTKVEPSALDLKPGEKYPRRELLYGLLLKSANDVAQALARDNAGSLDLFAEKMNRRARELGAVSSHFKNPHGLHHPQHFTTAHDLALLARAAMDQPLFRQIVGTQTHPWSGSPTFPELTNHNKLLHLYSGCTGIKTGYTIPAGQVLASSALRGGREVIAVVLHTDKPGIWEDSKKLLDYGFEHLPALLPE